MNFAFPTAHLATKFPNVIRSYGRLLEPLDGAIWTAYGWASVVIAFSAILIGAVSRVFTRTLSESKRNRGALTLLVVGLLSPVHTEMLSFAKGMTSGILKHKKFKFI